jgi:hypothetical protein
MSHQKGDRVGAIKCSTDTTVDFFGYGKYTGMIMPPKELGFPLRNPCIELDSGKLVYGFQCWWGPEEKIKELLVGKEVTHVEPEEVCRV